jgi:hypothetical protein
MIGTQFNDNGVLISLCVWEVYPQGVALEFHVSCQKMHSPMNYKNLSSKQTQKDCKIGINHTS